jgi:hypothetical protein
MRRSVLRLALLVLVAADPALASSAEPGSLGGKSPRVTVTYRGSGWWQTRYRSQPPNQGGAPDHNFADDSSTQRWSLRLAPTLSLSQCGHPSGDGTCPPPPPRLLAASGSTEATGTVDHRHIDGLFANQNASVRCRVSTSSPADRAVVLSLRYLPRRRAILATAWNPVNQALLQLPPQCPGQGDSLDGLNDNYFMPGFSFAPGYGAARWFKSNTVAVSLARLRRRASVTVRLSDTARGTPPPHCAVRSTATEQCAVSGAWAGVLRFSRG